MIGFLVLKLTLGQIKKKIMFQVMDLKILGRVYTHISFSGKIYNIILCFLKGLSPFKKHKIKCFTRNTEKYSRFQQ